MTEKEDRILRGTVPERWKHAHDPIACVQNYIVELEQALIKLGVDLDELESPFTEINKWGLGR